MEDFANFLPGIVAMVIGLIFGLIIYVYTSYSLMVMAQKTGTEGGWMAWVPIANMYLMCNIAQKPAWWLLIMLLVPIANAVFTILVWMAIAERLGKPSWIVILGVFVPPVGILLPGYLAFF